MKLQFRTIALLLIALLALSASVVAAQDDEENSDMMDSGAVVVLNADSATISEEALHMGDVFAKASAVYYLEDGFDYVAFDYLAFEGAFSWADAPNTLGEVELYIDADQANYTVTARLVVAMESGEEAETYTSNWEILELVEGEEYGEELIPLDKIEDAELTNVSVFVLLEDDAAISFGENLAAWLDEFRGGGAVNTCIPGISC